MLLPQADRPSGLMASVCRRLVDEHQRGKIEHGFVDLVRQRVYSLALGYEDLNDHADLPMLPAADRDRALASPSTLSRFKNTAD